MEEIEDLLEHYKIENFKCNQCCDTKSLINKHGEIIKCKHENNNRFRTNQKFKFNT